MLETLKEMMPEVLADLDNDETKWDVKESLEQHGLPFSEDVFNEMWEKMISHLQDAVQRFE